MREKTKLLLLGLAPLLIGWLFAKVNLLALNVDGETLRKTILYAFDLVYFIVPGLALYIGHTIGKHSRDRVGDTLCFFAPTAVFFLLLFTPLATLSRYFFLPIRKGLLGLLLAEWQYALLGILYMIIAFGLGWRSLDLGEYANFLALTAVILLLGALTFYLQDVGSLGAFYFIQPFLSIPLLILQVMRIIVCFRILRGLFRRSKS